MNIQIQWNFRAMALETVPEKREKMHFLDLQPEMVGRDHELKELQTYLDKVAGGEGNTIFISGEAGIGKTKLINELKQIAESKGFQILFGNSMYESLTPYMPFLDALKSGGLDYLFEEEAPRIEAIFLVTHSGVLIKEVMEGADVFVTGKPGIQCALKEVSFKPFVSDLDRV